jgi:hypothetical protein
MEQNRAASQVSNLCRLIKSSRGRRTTLVQQLAHARHVNAAEAAAGLEA